MKQYCFVMRCGHIEIDCMLVILERIKFVLERWLDEGYKNVQRRMFVIPPSELINKIEVYLFIKLLIIPLRGGGLHDQPQSPEENQEYLLN